MKSTAERMRRHRARRKSGRRVLRVEVDEAAIEVTLVALGYLNPNACDDPQKVEAAASAMLARLCAAYE